MAGRTPSPLAPPGKFASSLQQERLDRHGSCEHDPPATESSCSKKGDSKKKSSLSFSIENILGKSYSEDSQARVDRAHGQWTNIKPALRIPQPNFEERIVQVYHINDDLKRHGRTAAGLGSCELGVDEVEDNESFRMAKENKTLDDIKTKYKNSDMKDHERHEKFDIYDEDSSDDIDVTFAVDEDNADDGPTSNDEESAAPSSNDHRSMNGSPPRQLRLSMPHSRNLLKMSMGCSARSPGSSPDVHLGAGYDQSTSPKTPLSRKLSLDSTTSFSSSFSSPPSMTGRSISYPHSMMPPFWAAAGSEVKCLDMPRPTGTG